MFLIILPPHIEAVFISIHHRAPNTLLKHIHIRRSKLPRTNPLLKEEVQLRERAALRLRNPEVRVHDAQEADGAPEEARVVAPVPGARVEHVGG